MMTSYTLSETDLTVQIGGQTPHRLTLQKVHGGYHVTASFAPDDALRLMADLPARTDRVFKTPPENLTQLLERFQRWGPACFVQEAFRGYSPSFRDFLLFGLPEEVEERMDEVLKDAENNE